MANITKAEDLPEKEEVYLTKSNMFGWRVVHPIKNEDGKINWLNLLTGGSWWNWIFIAMIMIVIFGVLYEYSSNIKHFMDCFQSPQQLQVCKTMYG